MNRNIYSYACAHCMVELCKSIKKKKKILYEVVGYIRTLLSQLRYFLIFYI